VYSDDTRHRLDCYKVYHLELGCLYRDVQSYTLHSCTRRVLHPFVLPSVSTSRSCIYNRERPGRLPQERSVRFFKGEIIFWLELCNRYRHHKSNRLGKVAQSPVHMGVLEELCGVLCFLFMDDDRHTIGGRSQQHGMALPVKLIEQDGSLIDRSAHYAYTPSRLCSGKNGKSYVSTIHDSARCRSSIWVSTPLRYFTLPLLLTRSLHSRRTQLGCHKVRTSLGWIYPQAHGIRTRLCRMWNGNGRQPGLQDGPCGWQNL